MRNLCEDLCVVQAVRGAILPDFNPSKYEQIFNITSDEILKFLQDPVLPQVISTMCEKMFDIQINCSFQRKRKMLEQTEKDLVQCLLQTTVDIEDYLKYRSAAESIDLPNGYIESPYQPTVNTIRISSKLYEQISSWCKGLPICFFEIINTYIIER